MQIQIHTDSHIHGHEGVQAYVKSAVESALSHFKDHITRVEVHLTDEHGRKPGQDDKRCMMEARVEGRPPTAVTHHAGSVEDAVDGAAERLERHLEGTLGRLKEHR